MADFLKFFTFNYKKYKEMILKDVEFNATFRNGTSRLSLKEEYMPEFRIVKNYRKYQAI